MKPALLITGLAFAACLPLVAEEPADNRAKHKEGSEKIADEQDELSADVQQLVIEQTVPKVIELLGEVENLMDEATDKLAEADTGGDTLAAQTEIIEKIHAAAKERQSQSGSQSGGAMMDMMERMMGKQPQDGKPQKGEQPADKGGGGVEGQSDTANEAAGGPAGGAGEARRVPKAAGAAGTEIPSEFKKAFDAYNRGVEKKVK